VAELEKSKSLKNSLILIFLTEENESGPGGERTVFSEKN